MSGNQPPDPPSGETPAFPAIGQYELVPGPGDPGYVEPDPEPDDDATFEGDADDIEGEDLDDLDDIEE